MLVVCQPQPHAHQAGRLNIGINTTTKTHGETGVVKTRITPWQTLFHLPRIGETMGRVAVVGLANLVFYLNAILHFRVVDIVFIVIVMAIAGFLFRR